MKKITKKEIQAYFKTQLATSSKWAIAGMLKIYEYQTESEKAIGLTREDNGVGFSGAHSEICSSFAQQIQKGRNLSPKQMNIVFKIMPKYWKQLVSLSDTEKVETAIQARREAV